MNPHLVSYIDKKLEEAASFVTRYMPMNLSTDAIYEGLLSEPHVVAAFREAVKYLPQATHNRRVVVKLDGHELMVSLRLAPTEKYSVFLMPKYELTITQESELGQAMALAIQVSREWEMLTKTWIAFKTIALDTAILAFLFPWLREIMLDFHFGLLDVNIKLKSERLQIEREVKVIHCRAVPKRFPRLSIELNQVCQSGKRLFGQYRMLEAATISTDRDRAALSIDRASNLAPDWLALHLEEVLATWREELQALPQLERRKLRGVK
jgi:hypothetical protein